jgi:hypothetical protein
LATPEECEERYKEFGRDAVFSGGCALWDKLVVRHDQLQADLGLSVIHIGYERRLSTHVSATLSAGIYGTYFLPWLDLGDNVIGFGGGLRGTWFANRSGRGFYVAPYVRVHREHGDHDGVTETGVSVTAGAFAGWSFALGRKLDVRVGAGAQYIHQPHTSTAFPALDLVVAYRL